MKPEPTGEDLLRHLERHYSDRHIIESMDAIYDLCPDERTRAACKAYAKARRQAPGFDPSEYMRIPEKGVLQRNHASIPAAELRRIRELLLRQPNEEHTCSVCGVPFEARRRDARYCGAACRQRAHRGAMVTDKTPKTAPEGNHPRTPKTGIRQPR